MAEVGRMQRVDSFPIDEAKYLLLSPYPDLYNLIYEKLGPVEDPHS